MVDMAVIWRCGAAVGRHLVQQCNLMQVMRPPCIPAGKLRGTLTLVTASAAHPSHDKVFLRLLLLLLLFACAIIYHRAIVYNHTAESSAWLSRAGCEGPTCGTTQIMKMTIVTMSAHGMMMPMTKPHRSRLLNHPMTDDSSTMIDDDRRPHS